MKLIVTALAFASLAGGIVPAANAGPPHHRTCKWVVHHRHRMKKCW